MLTESRVLVGVSLMRLEGAINVKWDVVIQRDDEVISRVPHRKSYGLAHVEEFRNEVAGAEGYLALMGW